MTITKNVLFTNNIYITKHMSVTKTHPLPKTCSLPQTCQSQIYLYLKPHMGENIRPSNHLLGTFIDISIFLRVTSFFTWTKVELSFFTKRVQKKRIWSRGGDKIFHDDHWWSLMIIEEKLNLFFEKSVDTNTHKPIYTAFYPSFCLVEQRIPRVS